MSSSDAGATRTMVARIWDAPVRLFHWLLVALLCFSWWSGKQHEMEWHRRSGYCILALLIFRLYWGFVGGHNARFAQFIRGPRPALAYARSLLKGTYIAEPGHNPLGGWIVGRMRATRATMVVAGLFAVDVDGLESGPLADYVSFDQGRVAAYVHAFVFNLLLALIATHLVAILFYLVRLRHNLIGPMITGRGPARSAPVEQSRASWVKALLGIVLAGVSSYAVARGFRL